MAQHFNHDHHCIQKKIMLSFKILLLVLPAIVLASSDDWLLDLVAKRNGFPYSPDDNPDLETRQANNRPRLGRPRKFVRFLNFICSTLNKHESGTSAQETLLRNALTTFKGFKDSLGKTCEEYKAFRKELISKIASMRNSPPPTTPSPPPARRDLDEKFIRELLKLI